MRSLLFIACCVLLWACESAPRASSAEVPARPNPKLHTFYYSWYGNPETDSAYHHWRHDILPHWSDTTWDHAGTFPGGADIGANFYPSLGCYSSRDTHIIKQHLEMMVRADIGVFVISWWGKDSREEPAVASYLNLAERYGMQMAFHLEPFYHSAGELKLQLDYLAARYGAHPALYQQDGKPVYYVYDSYKLNSAEWQKLLRPEGTLSVRGQASDGIFIGLWVKENEGSFFVESGFDGYYTYFASEGFVYGSTPANWPEMARFARENDLLFVPCAGPGYLDTRIRPWNGQNTKARAGGDYYREMFAAAVRVKPDFIGITSFNEWHEGTQIEPAQAQSIPGYTYQAYDTTPEFYLDLTRELSATFPDQPLR